jgi:NAD(P)-dependent dehydrogenase (short-subunit alcohol dehydrogenase family)
MAEALLAGRRAVVTGAGDIGRVIVGELVAHGASVVVWGLDEPQLAEVAAAGGGRVSTTTVDVTSRASVEDAAATAQDRLGGVDVLVASAAIQGPIAPVVDTDDDQWRLTLDINLTGVFTCCRALLPALKASPAGSIVNVSSIGGVRGEPEIAAYCASKFGVIGFSESLADEVGRDGVRVNCVCPGAVDSRMNTELLAAVAESQGQSLDEVVDGLLAVTALGRLVTAQDVARAVVFLASDLAQGVTRQSLLVDCGLRG